MTHPPKRPRTDGTDDISDVTIHIPLPNAFTNMVQAASNVSAMVFIFVEHDTIVLQSMSTKHDCMITGSLVCTTELPHGLSSSDLCIDTRTLLRTLKSLATGQTLSIRYSPDDDQVTLRAMDEETYTCRMTWKIARCIEDAFRCVLSDIKYKYEWMYDTATLKQDLKRCKQISSDGNVTLSLYETSHDDGELLGTLVELHACSTDSEVKIEHVTSTANDQAANHAHLDCPRTRVVNQSFSVCLLCEFLRAVDTHTHRVQMRIGTGVPLVAHVPMIGDGSYMQFVLGAV